MDTKKRAKKTKETEPKGNVVKRQRTRFQIQPVAEYKPQPYDIRKHHEYRPKEYKSRLPDIKLKVIPPYDLKQYDYHYEYIPDFHADKDGPPVQSVKKKYEKTDLVNAEKINQLGNMFSGVSFAMYKMKKRLGDKRLKEAAEKAKEESEAINQRNLYSRIGDDTTDTHTHTYTNKAKGQTRHKKFVLTRPQMIKGDIPQEW